MPMRQYGFWNWNDQLMLCPAALNPETRAASARNQTKMPATNASPSRKTFCGDSPAWLMKPKIFSAMTGSTHGMRFRMNPPRKPKARNFGRPELEGMAVAAPAGAMAAEGGVDTDSDTETGHALRDPSREATTMPSSAAGGFSV